MSPNFRLVVFGCGGDAVQALRPQKTTAVFYPKNIGSTSIAPNKKRLFSQIESFFDNATVLVKD